MAITFAGYPALGRVRRALLPAVDGAAAPAAGRQRSPRDWLVDSGAFALAMALAAADVYGYADRAAVALVCLDAGMSVAACASLWLRRRRPLAVGLLTIVASGLVGGARGAALVGLFTVAVHRSPRWTTRLLALAFLASGLSAALHRTSQHHYDWRALEAGVLLSAGVVGYGLWVRARRALVVELLDRNRREARRAERARIAREMHDVLAHRISLLSVHAGALEYSPDGPPDQLAHAAGVIRESARAAQEELRAVIGLLRDDERNAAEVEPPQPALGDLRELIAESRHAGMDLTCDLALDVDALPPPLGRTLYRTVQEALTNARKHAPGQKVTITIAGQRGGTVTVQVINRPRVGHAPEQPQLDGSGTGLIGLGERVQIAGGELSSQALADGGFALVAALPWESP